MSTVIVETGEFAGWKYWADEAFEAETAGPFYFTVDDKGPVTAFRATKKHMNGGGVVHGGCLMTFADFSLFALAQEHMDDSSYGLTIAFTSEFISGASLNDLIESRGEVLRAGGSLVFVRGLVTANGVPCLNYSGTIKRVKKR